jgi:phenylpyruvate tautomerase PptA (4-oxalocrotonate tautomerase family)
MPLYTITTQSGALSGEAKASLAEDLTAFHSDYAGVPRNWVHVIFQDYPVGNGFTEGKPAPATALTLLIRTGRPADYRGARGRKLMSRTPAPEWLTAAMSS